MSSDINMPDDYTTEQQDLDVAAEAQQQNYEWREQQQQQDEAELAEIRQKKRLEELWRVALDQNMRFEDPRWEEAYLRGLIKADNQMREIFMAGVQAGIELHEKETEK